jgi:ribosomal protein S18 acetylase RimI-like enzyme
MVLQGTLSSDLARLRVQCGPGERVTRDHGRWTVLKCRAFRGRTLTLAHGAAPARNTALTGRRGRWHRQSTMNDIQHAARIAGETDIETVTEIITRSFADDPVWGPAYGSAFGGGPRAIWRLEVEAAIRLGWTWLSSGSEAAVVWVPPGSATFDAPEMRAYLAFLRELLGSGFDRVAALHERFEAAEPRDPHFYLCLLGTHPDQRGHGYGMRLLAETLRLVDAEGMPAYLESTNPANNARYEGVGFEVTGTFEGLEPESVVTTMWRPARR